MDIQYWIKYAALAVGLWEGYAMGDVLIMRACGRISMEVKGYHLAHGIIGSIAWALFFAL